MTGDIAAVIPHPLMTAAAAAEPTAAGAAVQLLPGINCLSNYAEVASASIAQALIGSGWFLRAAIADPAMTCPVRPEIVSRPEALTPRIGTTDIEFLSVEEGVR